MELNRSKRKSNANTWLNAIGDTLQSNTTLFTS